MSARSRAVAAALGNRVASVTGNREVYRGEKGENIRVQGHNGRYIDVFLADNRKIQDGAAVRIVQSYLSRIGVSR